MSQSLLPVLPCMCGSFRRASRALTQLYEQPFRPFGLPAAQPPTLEGPSLAGEVPQGQRGEILGGDRGSLTRTLAIMGREGWVTARRGKDRRERWVRLSSAGEMQLSRALPVWEKVQSRLRHRLGAHAWENLLVLTDHVQCLVKTHERSLWITQSATL